MTEGVDHVVGIPTYNNEDSITSTIELLAGQTLQPSLVVICDASSDSTVERARETADRTGLSLRVLDQRGDGVADAYNQILDSVAGEYDVFATTQTGIQLPDDWLETHVNIHASNPGVDVVTGDRRVHSDTSAPGKERPTGRCVDPTEPTYYVGRNFSAKRGALESIDGWDGAFLRGEDWDMRVRLAGADTTVYATREAWWDWQDGVDDPPVTLSKATRRPTAVTFLAKYGTWYARFHPSHVVGDGLSGAGVLAGAAAPVLALASSIAAAVALGAFLLLGLAYVAGHWALRGSAGSNLGMKYLLTGIGVWAALYRLATLRPDWNLSGFDAERVQSYGF